MHSGNYDKLFFATKYVEGLRDDIKATVEPHVPTTVDKVAIIAKIQQRTLERAKSKFSRNTTLSKVQAARNDSTNTPHL